MKSALAVLLLVATTHVSAETALDMFSTKENYTPKSIVTWVQVDNVNQACEKESRRRGFGGFALNMEACSFWDADKKTGEPICYVITARKVNYWQLGHEIRHCFQGPWHK